MDKKSWTNTRLIIHFNARKAREMTAERVGHYLTQDAFADMVRSRLRDRGELGPMKIESTLMSRYESEGYVRYNFSTLAVMCELAGIEDVTEFFSFEWVPIK
jgi:hypothetical protein